MHPYAAKMLVRRRAGRLRRGASRRHLRDRRPGVVDPRWVGVPGRRGAHARGAASGRRRRRCELSRRRRPSRRSAAARRRRRAPRGLLAGAVVGVQRALLDRLVDPRARAGGARPRSPRHRPAATARSSRRKWVLTALCRRRFSSRSRSERWMRLTCEAMLAIGRPATIATADGGLSAKDAATTSAAPGALYGARRASPRPGPGPVDRRSEEPGEALAVAASPRRRAPGAWRARPRSSRSRPASRGSPAWSARSSPRATSASAARCRRSRSPSRSRTWSAACSPTRRSRRRSCRSSPSTSSAGNKREAFRLASTLIFLVTLVLTAAHGAVHPDRAGPDAAVRRLRGSAGAHRHPARSSCSRSW